MTIIVRTTCGIYIAFFIYLPTYMCVCFFCFAHTHTYTHNCIFWTQDSLICVLDQMFLHDRGFLKIMRRGWKHASSVRWVFKDGVCNFKNSVIQAMKKLYGTEILFTLIIMQAYQITINKNQYWNQTLTCKLLTH